MGPIHSGPMDESQIAFDGDMTLKDFLNGILGLALKDEALVIRGHFDRGGCIVRYTFTIDSVDLATAFHSNQEKPH